MTRRTALILLLVAIFVVGAGIGYSFSSALAARDIPHQEGDFPTFIGFFSFAVVGALLTIKQRAGALGWFMIGVPTAAMVSLAAPNYAVYALRVRPLPGMLPAAWIGTWAWFPPLICLLTFVLLLFPTGRLPTPRWRWAAWAAGASIGLLVTSLGLMPGEVDFRGGGIQNPLGIEGASGILGVSAALGGFLFLVAAVAGVISLFVRARRAAGDERQQVKWFAFAAMTNVGMIVLAEIFPVIEDFGGDVLFGVQISLLPLAVAVAIFRYRLYDIDVIINRALVYAVLTAVLVGAYASGVLLFRTALDPLTGDNDVAIATSTLAVAALFGPARRRVQAFIDRRFYRRKYDVARTLEEFADRLRDEVDLDDLGTKLVAVVGETMQPAHASLWLREAQ